MTRRALLAYGVQDYDSSIGSARHIGNIVDWCQWLIENTEDLTLTLFWSSYSSPASLGDQVLEESLALAEAHTHLILLGTRTGRLDVQAKYALASRRTVIDLTPFGLVPPDDQSVLKATIKAVLV